MNDRQRYAEASLRVLREPYVGHGKLEVLPKVVVRDLNDGQSWIVEMVFHPAQERLFILHANGDRDSIYGEVAKVVDSFEVIQDE